MFVTDPQTGIWGVGTGWEMGLWALDAYLRGEFPAAGTSDSDEEPAAIRELAAESSRAWAALVASLG